MKKAVTAVAAALACADVLMKVLLIALLVAAVPGLPAAEKAPQKESRAEKANRERAERLARQKAEREAKARAAKEKRERAAHAKKGKPTKSAKSQTAKALPKDFVLPADCTSINLCWCPWYQHKWGDVPHDSMEPLEQEKLDAISDHYIEQCRQAVANKPDYMNYRTLGEALIFREKWEEAREMLQKGLAVRREETLDGVWFHYRIAETYFAQGKTAEAIAELKRGIDLNIIKVPRNYEHWPNLSKSAWEFLTGKDIDHYKLPRDTGFAPFPEPQEASYSGLWGEFRRVSINVKGLEKDDARVEFLKRKLRARGVEVSSAGYSISLSLEKLAPVANPEGYALAVSPRSCTIRARDPQGILWGVVSLLQVTDFEKKRVRCCTVNDWPGCPRRGFIGHLWPGCTEFMLFNKMNCTILQYHPMLNGRDTPLHVYQCAALAKEMKGLGLTLYYGIKSWTMDMGWPYCWKSYLGMQAEICKKIAAMDAGVYYPNDDARYWPEVLRKEDLATGLKPSDFDAPHIYDLFTAVKDEYPGFKMVYCPPFYWGPNGRNPYPDDRDKYLRSLRALPEEVAIIWTGDRVKSYKKTPEMVKWFRDLTGRKPLLFQNGTAPHNYLSYIVDRTDWNGWHYPGFFENDVYGYLKNSGTPEECPQLTTLADCLWNSKAYDKERSIRRGLAQFAGAGFFEALDPVLRDLSYIDRFGFGVFDTSVRDDDPVKVEATLKRIEEATAKAAKINGWEFLGQCGRWTWAVNCFRTYCELVKHPPDYHAKYKEQLDRARAQARADGYCPENGDVLIVAADLHHSQCKLLPETPPRGAPPPDQLYVCGVWDDCFADANFDLAVPRAKGDVKILMNAMFDRAGNQKPSGEMKLTVNGKDVYDGQVPFHRYRYETHEFHAPQSYFNLKGKNSIVYRNGPMNWQLWINYIIIKFATERVRPL